MAPTQKSDRCPECFMILCSHIEKLFDASGDSGGYSRAFATLFGHDIESFNVTMPLYLDQLKQQIIKSDFSINCCNAA